MRPIFTTTMSFGVAEKERLAVLKKHRIRYIDIFREGMAWYERKLGIKGRSAVKTEVPVETVLPLNTAVQSTVVESTVVVPTVAPTEIVIERKYEI